MTPKQYECLREICLSIAEKGYGPSYEDLTKKLGLKSRSGSHRLIDALEKEGYITRKPNHARSIRICDDQLPQKLVSELKWQRRINPPNGPENKFQLILQEHERRLVQHEQKSCSLPFYGKISAGTPFTAFVENGTVNVPTNMISHGHHYTLEASGDSMEGAGILDGDLLIVQSTNLPRNDQIVVALINQSDVTLKFYYSDVKNGVPYITLKPANPLYKNIRCPASDVTIQGRVVAVLRRYN